MSDTVASILAKQKPNESNFSKIAKYLVNDSIPAQAVKSLWSGFTYPGDVLAGKATPDDYGRALDFAGMAALGGLSQPVSPNEIRMGMGAPKKSLPSSSSLNSLSTPSLEQISQYSSIRDVPLDMIRASQPKMDWEAFNSGKYAPPMFPGFEDLPVASLKRNGEYIVFDGHHRSVQALNEGKAQIPMYVIDASVYDPANAGIAARPMVTTMTDDELLKELGL